MHISNWTPETQEKEAEAQDRALLRLQAILLAASAVAFVTAMACGYASHHLSCTALLAVAPC